MTAMSETRTADTPHILVEKCQRCPRSECRRCSWLHIFMQMKCAIDKYNNCKLGSRTPPDPHAAAKVAKRAAWSSAKHRRNRSLGCRALSDRQGASPLRPHAGEDHRRARRAGHEQWLPPDDASDPGTALRSQSALVAIQTRDIADSRVCRDAVERDLSDAATRAVLGRLDQP